MVKDWVWRCVGFKVGFEFVAFEGGVLNFVGRVIYTAMWSDW